MMKNNISFNRFVFVAIFSVLSSSLLFAGQEITEKQAKELLKKTETAQAAVGRIMKSGNAESRKDAGIADKELQAVTGLLSKYVNQSGGVKTSYSDVYKGGTRYPAASKVRIKKFDVAIGATKVHVPISLDRPSTNTVIAFVRVFNGKGGRAKPDTTKTIIFRPGDPLVKTLSFDVGHMYESNSVLVNQPSVPDGAIRVGGNTSVMAKKGAVNEPIVDTSRKPLQFKPLGKLSYEATAETIKFDDKGGPDTFSTSLSHGRVQVGNQETGYYGPVNMGGFVKTPEGLAICSRRLETPVKIGTPATEYPFLASMLSGHKTPDTFFKYGSVEWVVKMPNRLGSWPALWLVSTGGWPPEIDVYEGFGYGGGWHFPSRLSSNIHGGDKQVRTFTRAAMRMRMKDFGLPSTLDTEFHKFAVTVDEDWITMFVDDVETMRYANPFRGEGWYPLMNVAVKAKVNAPYDKGSGDMIFRSIKIWKAE